MPASALRASSAVLPVVDDGDDPRDRRGRRHQLGCVLSIALCAMLCGARSVERDRPVGRGRAPARPGPTGRPPHLPRAGAASGSQPRHHPTCPDPCGPRCTDPDELGRGVGGAGGGRHDRPRLPPRRPCGGAPAGGHDTDRASGRPTARGRQDQRGPRTRRTPRRPGPRRWCGQRRRAAHLNRHLVEQRQAHDLLCVKTDQSALWAQVKKPPWSQAPVAGARTRPRPRPRRDPHHQGAHRPEPGLPARGPGPAGASVDQEPDHRSDHAVPCLLGQRWSRHGWRQRSPAGRAPTTVRRSAAPAPHRNRNRTQRWAARAGVRGDPNSSR
ncbi:transposase family protein [Thermobifida halotolerans]|uniref:Transposase family protein n=1 Tax=Thermobifida halotolerans TaxID=483545 RepID=A0AA97M5X2_9ACTN|nr:transposase family protein [Thermobifida halotolerans]